MALIFLKLGGSLITDKTRPYTPRPEKLDLLAAEIASALKENPDLQLVLGHGSGSFGHAAASRYNTRLGVSGNAAWRGFAEVWYQASALNRLVLEALVRARLPAVTLSPVASVTARDGKISSWNLSPIQAALSNGILPVIHGDVVFDDDSRRDNSFHRRLIFPPCPSTSPAAHPAGWSGKPVFGRIFRRTSIC